MPLNLKKALLKNFTKPDLNGRKTAKLIFDRLQEQDIGIYPEDGLITDSEDSELDEIWKTLDKPIKPRKSIKTKE